MEFLRRALRRTDPLGRRSLTVAGRAVPVEVREHATARRIVMRIAPGGEAIRLTVPRRTAARVIDAFLERHRGWAAERLAERPAAVAIADGSSIPFRGGFLILRADGSRRGTALVDGASGERGTLFVGGSPDHFRRRVRDALVREARRDLEAAVARHAAAAGVRPRSVTLRDTRSRWGSCSADRSLSFSWRIVLAPPAVLDYLAAHEVAHLREMNHGPDFWALCRELCPGADEARLWLRREGASLHAIDFG